MKNDIYLEKLDTFHFNPMISNLFSLISLFSTGNVFLELHVINLSKIINIGFLD